MQLHQFIFKEPTVSKKEFARLFTHLIICTHKLLLFITLPGSNENTGSSLFMSADLNGILFLPSQTAITIAANRSLSFLLSDFILSLDLFILPPNKPIAVLIMLLYYIAQVLLVIGITQTKEKVFLKLQGIFRCARLA